MQGKCDSFHFNENKICAEVFVSFHTVCFSSMPIKAKDGMENAIYNREENET